MSTAVATGTARSAAARSSRPAILPALAEAVLVAAMVLAGSLAFGAAYGGSRWLIAAAGGALLGASVSWAVTALRWHPLVIALSLAIVYFLFGAALATPDVATGGVLPSIESVRLLTVGVVTSWKQALTVAVPVGSSGALLIPVFLTTLVCGGLGAGLVGRSRRPLLALVAPVLTMAVAGLMGADQAFAPVAGGGAVAVGGVLVASLVRRRQGRGGIELRRWISAVVVVAAAVASALYLGPTVLPATSRLAVRDSVTPPFEPQDYPSPLAGFRQYFRTDAAKAATLFTVTGLPPKARMRLATLDTYDGVSYSVSTSTGSFDRVGDRIQSAATGTPADLHVSIGTYAGVYLPDAGALTGISFTGSDRGPLTESFRYAVDSGVGVETDGLAEGDRYDLTTLLPIVPSAAELQGATVSQTSLVAPSRIPDLAKTFATKYAGTASTDYARVAAVTDAIKSQGYLSHGSQGEETSPSGEGLDRMTRLLGGQKMVGDQEQYAPALSLMLWSLNIPNRVVMGFAPKAQGPGPIAVTGGDVTAWVEVPFDGFGWVTFDPTPDENRVTQQPKPQPQASPRKQVLQPPPPPQLPQQAKSSDADQTNTQDTNKKKDDDKSKPPVPGSGSSGWIVGVAVGVPLLLICLAIALILLLKARRRNVAGPAASRAGSDRRRLEPDPRRGNRSRYPVTDRTTRAETAAALDAHFATGTVLLARQADAQVFGPGGIGDEDVSRFWSEVDAALLGITSGQSRWRRLRARLSTASLRRRRTDRP